MTNNWPSNETTWMPPHAICGEIIGVSSQFSNLPAENLAGNLVAASSEFNIPCSSSSLQGELSTHNLYATTPAYCEIKEDKLNSEAVIPQDYYLANFGAVASNSNCCSPFASLTHRNEPSVDPSSNHMQIISLLSCSSDQCSEVNGSNITHFSNVPNNSLYKGPLSPIQAPYMVMQQKYLHVMRQILFNVASHAVSHLSETGSSVLGLERELNVPLDSPICRKEMAISSNDDEIGFMASTVGQNCPDECDVAKADLVQMLKMVNSYFFLIISNLSGSTSTIPRYFQN
jgi:hypothetical protein